MNTNQIFLPCECRTEGLFVEKDTDYKETLYNISIFSSKYRRQRMSLKVRLKLIWDIITKGTFFKDDITLSQNQINQFKKFIS